MRPTATLALILCACSSESETPSTTTTPTSVTTTSQTTVTETGTATTTETGTTTTTPTDIKTITVLPSDEHVGYIGRWDQSDPAAPVCGWQGSTIRFAFKGTDAAVELNPGATTESFRVIIDGDPDTSFKVNVDPGTAWYTVASGLPYGEHDISIVRETYNWDNVTFTGLQVTGSLLDIPNPRPHFIEFYGDSNFAGYSLEHEENNSNSNFIGNHFGVTGIAARMLDADYTNIANSGDTVSGIHGRFDQIEWYDANNKWDFDANPTDVVVVNLGANDVGTPEARIKEDYHAFLDDLRATHPDAHIVLFNSFGWDYDEPANYTDEVVAERKDDNLAVLLFPWVFEQWHGCETDQAGMAIILADHISSVMGWPTTPSDVVSSFGIDGDVGNGGFEGIAPFGGYGWRYKDDAGVSRITDAAQAHSGSVYLQLENGAETHQPQPAVDGQTVTVSMWLRGPTAGSEATITLDFRDQEMWTATLDSSAQTVEVGTDWTEVTHTFTATGYANPVFHTRVTVAAGPMSTIYVDDISMTIE
jgi:hypothetical protein